MPSPISSGAADIRRDSFLLSNAEVIALPTTPIELLAAPGANRQILPFYAHCRLQWVADYTNIHAQCVIDFKIGPGGNVLLSFKEPVQSSVTGLLAGGGPDGSIGWSPALFSGLVAAAPGAINPSAVSSFYDSDLVNQPLTISADNQGSGIFTGGDAGNSLKVTVLYSIMDI